MKHLFFVVLALLTVSCGSNPQNDTHTSPKAASLVTKHEHANVSVWLPNYMQVSKTDYNGGNASVYFMSNQLCGGLSARVLIDVTANEGLATISEYYKKYGNLSAIQELVDQFKEKMYQLSLHSIRKGMINFSSGAKQIVSISGVEFDVVTYNAEFHGRPVIGKMYTATDIEAGKSYYFRVQDHIECKNERYYPLVDSIEAMVISH